MAKKVWVSLPLTVAAEATDEAVVAFTKGGPKKELEVEVAAFIMKWLMDRNVPFVIDFESSTVDRKAALDALPRRLQKALGYKTGTQSEDVPEGAQAPQSPTDSGPDSVVAVEPNGGPVAGTTVGHHEGPAAPENADGTGTQEVG